ncbi:MAG: EAL domain-containing protein [Betaproteobacteria bacterium]|nr:EAL domain-containing protein [Betaproteobacteria bacterium]MDE2623341.1 EAL domain-containing protein [Betaproteobacteria bacterium]
MESHSYFLGRQQILDRQQNLAAYELLFRNSLDNRAEVTDNLTASATVINHAFAEFGLEKALGTYPGFINADETLLMSDLLEMLPRDKVVLELLETIEITPAVVERCRSLKAKGFRLALDDCTQITETHHPVLELVDVVKVDILAISQDALSDLARKLGNWQHLTLLAEKVDSREQFELCLSLGFHLFQGYYFAKPQVIEGKRLSHSELGLLKLLGQLMTDEEDLIIENTLKQYPSISFKLLRLANSAAFNTRDEIRTIGSALRIIGRNQMRRWLQVLLYANETGKDGARPSPLLVLAATRGTFMESLALLKGSKTFGENAFITGMLSLMDTLFGVPLEEILEAIPLDTSIISALKDQQGDLGKLLNLAINLEQDNPESLEDCLRECQFLSLEAITRAEVHALEWANNISV